MSFSPNGHTPWDTLPQTMTQVRSQCVRCGHRGRRQRVPLIPQAFGAAKPRLPIPPKRCDGCWSKYPAVNYVSAEESDDAAT